MTRESVSKYGMPPHWRFGPVHRVGVRRRGGLGEAVALEERHPERLFSFAATASGIEAPPPPMRTSDDRS